MVTLLVPFSDDRVPDVTVEEAEVICGGHTLTPWDATAMTITVNGREDFYFDLHKHWSMPWTSGRYAGAGRLYHSRCM